MADVSVLGAGSFGVALAVLLSKNGHRVTIRSTSPEKAERLGRERSIPTLPEVAFSGRSNVGKSPLLRRGSFLSM